MKTFAMLAFAALAMVVGCGENQSNPMTSTSTDFAPQPAAKNAAPGATHFDLTAGRHTVIGEVTIWNDATNLYVNYNTDESGIGLVTTHVNVNSAADGAVITQDDGKSFALNGDDGRPTPGQYGVVDDEKLQTDHSGTVTDFTYTIPLSDIDLAGGCDLVVVTHAAMANGETAFGGNNPVNLEGPGAGGSWWFFSNFSLVGVDCSNGGGGGDGEFDACDTNEDGIVDAAEAVACAPSFDPCDTNQDGTVDSGEALACNPVDETYNITGNVSWADVNSTDIEGIVVELLDAAGDVIATATTDADGNYSFTELLDGDYTVQVAAGQIAQHGTGPQAVTIGGADGVADFVFELATISGDLSWADDGATAIDGIIVELLDGAGNVIATATTDANGAYSFEVLPGDYTVQVAAGQIDQDVTAPQSVTVGANGADVVDVDFVAQLPTISGTITWADDATTPIAGIEVYLSNGETVITDADGNYTFTVLPGDYTVDVTDGQIAQDYNGAQSVSIGADSNYASVENVDFVYQLPTISGNVYFDITGDLLLSSDEPGIQGVTMTLSDGQTVITDADGNYTFTVLPGDYTVSVGDVQGMDLVTAPSIDVSINADTQYASVAGVDFGLALNIADFCGQLADGFTIGFWKNNVSKAIAGRNKGVQVDAATINSYVDMIADYALEPFDGIDEQGAVDVLSSKSSDAADLLAKQLMGSEFNLMNGAYIGGSELVTEMFIHYGEYLVKHAGDYSRSELLDAKDWYDAYNNSHGGAIAGPDCQ